MMDILYTQLHFYVFMVNINAMVPTYMCNCSMHAWTPVCLFVCLFVWLVVCLFVCLFACLSVCHTYVCLCACMCARVHVCRRACAHVCMFACVYVCMCSCVHTHSFMHACMLACLLVCLVFALFVCLYVALDLVLKRIHTHCIATKSATHLTCIFLAQPLLRKAQARHRITWRAFSVKHMKVKAEEILLSNRMMWDEI